MLQKKQESKALYLLQVKKMSGKAVSCLATLIAVTILLVCKSSNVWGLQPDETQGSVAHGHRPHENVAHSWPHANVAHLSIDKASALPTNPKLFGLNDVLGPVMQIPYDSVALTSAVESLRVGYLRHPGGTVVSTCTSVLGSACTCTLSHAQSH